ncbi:hypothetical protein [Actinoplanes sp. NPDC049316]|uniref:WD40 repeat domain-containing protein n=1 Tax=Actinoplanes sp. NPDC049316 TaxID=3154727 RepID=UPI00342F909D
MPLIEGSDARSRPLPAAAGITGWDELDQWIKDMYDRSVERSYRGVAQRSRKSGHPVAPNTVAALVRGERRPQRSSLEGFLHGCGLNAQEVADGLAAWDRLTGIAAATAPAPADATGWQTAAGIDGDGRDHFRQKALGQRNTGQGGDLFRGRDTALSAVRSWLNSDDEPGLPLVVTGQPGAGKSSVVARAGREVNVGTGRLGLMFFARDATHEAFLRALGDSLGQRGLHGTIDVVEAVRRAARHGRFLLVVDALDESGSPADRDEIVTTMMALAALRGVRIVVATRRLSAQNPFTTMGLLASLGVRSAAAHSLVDLDDDHYFDPDGLRAVAAALLRKDGADNPAPPGAAWEQYRADPSLTDRLAAIIGRRAGRNYLVAALAAHPLSMEAAPLDPLAADFDESRLPTSVREALSKYLDHLIVSERVRVRGLLTVLAYARGTGLDDRLWLRFAEALDVPVSTADLEQLRDSPAADYLLQSNRDRDGTPVTRLFHQALADELKEQRNRRSDDERRLFESLRPAEPQDWSDAAYACRHAADHAAAAGRLAELLDDPGFLAHGDLFRLLPLIPVLPDPALAGTAAVLRRSAGRADGLPPGPRTQLLMLTATHLQEDPLRRRLQTVAESPHLPLWAHGLGRSHQQIALAEQVTALAVGRFGGTDVLVTASRSSQLLQVLDANGQLLTKIVTPFLRGVAALSIGTLAGAQVVVALGHDGGLRAWDESLHVIDLPVPRQPAPVTAVAVGPLGGIDLIVTATDRTMQLWTLDGAPFGNRFPAADLSVQALAIGTWGGRQMLASVGLDGMVRFWHPRRGQMQGRVVAGHRQPARAIALGCTREDDIVAVAYDNRIVQVWKGKEFGPADPFTDHTDMVNTVAIGQLGERRIIATGSRDGMIRVWDGPTGAVDPSASTDHTRPINSLAIGPLGDETVLVSTGEDNSVRIWNLDGQPLGPPLVSAATSVYAALGVVDGTTLVGVVGRGGSVRLWDHRRRPVQLPLTRRPHAVVALQMCEVGGRDAFVTVHHGGLVGIWDSSGRRTGVTFGHWWASEVTALANGRLRGINVVALGYSDGTVAIYDPADGALIRRTAPTGSEVTALAIGHNMLAAGHVNGAVRLLDGSPRSSFRNARHGHHGRVSAATIGAACGQPIVATVGADRTARIWHKDSSEPEVFELLEAPRGVALTPHDQLVIATGPALCGWQLCF